MAAATGESIANTFYSPETWIYKNSKSLQKFSNDYPLASRVTYCILAILGGFAKTILFPIVSAVGAVALPIIGLIRAALQKADACAYIKAGAWCLLGVFTFATFAMVSAYYIPMPVSGAIFAIAVASCVAYHVHRACQSPDEPIRSAANAPAPLPHLV